MASFKAKIEARKLLKNLAVGSTPQTTNNQASETARNVNEREKIRHGDNILRQKYEELGRLLALQHLEQNVVSSIDSMNIHMRSKGHPSKASKRHRRTSTKGKESKKSSEQKGKSKSPGYVFVKIPQAYSEKLNESDEHKVETKLTNQRRRRPKSARVQPAQDPKVSSQTSTRKKAKRRSNKSNSFRFEPTGSNKECGSDYFVPYDEYSYKGGHGDAMFLPRQSVNAQLFDIPEGGEEIVFEEVNEEPLFVIQGEIEITETVSYKVGEDEINNDKVTDDTQTYHNDKQSPERSKRVSFLENSDEHVEKKSFLNDLIDDETRTSVNHDKIEDNPLHIVLEKEILNELLHSPRPGLYQKKDKSTDEMQIRTPRKKKKAKPSKNVKNNKENPKGIKKTNSDKNVNHETPTDAISPRNTPTTPRTSDHKLDTTDNQAIKLWLKKKNKLIRQQKREERKKERSKQLAEENEMRERMEKMLKSDKLVNEWDERKRKEQKDRKAAEKKVKKAVRKATSEMLEKQEKDEAKVGVRDGKNTARGNFEKVKKTGRSRKKSKVHPGGESKPENESRDKKLNLQKTVSYEEWLRQKRAHDRKIRLQKEKMAHDPELDDIIPSLGRRRVENATARRGRRFSEEEPGKEDSIPSDLPESDQRFENPFKLPSEKDKCTSSGSSKPRPSSARPRSSLTSFVTKRNGNGIDTGNKSFQNVSHRYAWDGDKSTDKGYETLSSDNSNASVGIQSKTIQKNESRNRSGEEEKDEGIFLTEPIP